MLVWGGMGVVIGNLDTRARSDPESDSWTTTSTTNVPFARYSHTAVWTGSEMIVWGGTDGLTFLNTGGRYNPGTNTWIATATTNAPRGRVGHSCVWSGPKMILGGGYEGGHAWNDGGG